MRLVRLLSVVLLLLPALAQATDYYFTSPSDAPPCQATWRIEGSTWYCDWGSAVVVASGDRLLPASSITLIAKPGLTLSGNNTVGSPTATVNLGADWSSGLTVGSGSTLYGSVITTSSGVVSITNASIIGDITTSGTVSLSGASVSGNVTSQNGVTATNGTTIDGNLTVTNGTVMLSDVSVGGDIHSLGAINANGTTVGGNLTSTNGLIQLTGGSVTGAVHTGCCTVTTTNTDVGNGISSGMTNANGNPISGANTITVNGGTISGPIYTHGGNGISINDAQVTGGGITTQNVPIVITNSTVAGPISSQGGTGITIDGSAVTSGPITSNQPITITNGSVVGSPTEPVEVKTSHNLFIQNNSIVYGYVEGAPWQDPGKVVDNTSTVHGECVNGSHSSSNQPGDYNFRCDGDPTGGTGPGLHHIRIEHAGGGVTCAPTTLVIRACANADCETPFTGGVSGELTKSGTPTVNWIGGSGFTIDSSGETTKQVHVTTVGTLTWGTDAGVTHCYVGATESCSFTAAQAAFFVDVPNHAAGTMQPITVSAVRASDNAQVCVPAFSNVSKTVNFSCAYSNPASGSLPLVVGGNAVSCPASTGVSLSFNANGVANTTVSYADVGQMSLTASYSGTGDEAGLVMTGTDSFIVAPHSFGVTATGPFVAGVPFTVMVTAKNAQGNTTPNFGKENPPEGVALAHTLVAPVNGNDPPLTGTTLVSGASFSAGGWTGTDSLSWGEVGDISVTATLSNADGYLGSGLTANGSGNAGPFRPHHFITEVTPGTGTFTYSGQPFTVKVTARNTNNLTTQNYQGSYAKAVTLSDGNSAANNSATLGAFTNAQVPAAAFALGEGETDGIVYTFSDKQTAPLEAANALKLRATDADGVTSAGATEGETPIRAGRLRLINFHGSERLAPRVEYRLEYWDGNRWTVNGSDLVTAIDAGHVASGGLTVSSILPNTGGGGFIVFNTAAQGSYDIAVNLNTSGSDTSCNTSHGGAPASLPWLQGFWAPEDSCDGTLPWKQDPNARIRLGSPKAPYIYLRERY